MDRVQELMQLIADASVGRTYPFRIEDDDRRAAEAIIAADLNGRERDKLTLHTALETARTSIAVAEAEVTRLQAIVAAYGQQREVCENECPFREHNDLQRALAEGTP